MLVPLPQALLNDDTLSVNEKKKRKAEQNQLILLKKELCNYGFYCLFVFSTFRNQVKIKLRVNIIKQLKAEHYASLKLNQHKSLYSMFKDIVMQG